METKTPPSFHLKDLGPKLRINLFGADILTNVKCHLKSWSWHLLGLLLPPGELVEREVIKESGKSMLRLDNRHLAFQRVRRMGRVET